MKLPRVRTGLILKGICMGIADVIPGVSGGTMALILGIYRELVDSLGSLNLRWVRPLLEGVSSGFRPDVRRRLRARWNEMNPGFLIPLGTGILVAVAGGSLLIPPLMADYPVAVRGFFFGLILASVGVPFRMIRGRRARMPRVLLAAVPALIVGWAATAPGPFHLIEPDWTPRLSRGETLGELLARAPSAQPAPRVYWAPRNRSLRRHVRRTRPDRARRLRRDDPARPAPSRASSGGVRARSGPYERLVLPRDLEVHVPRLPLPYVFLAAAVAISAMILPGISGSYVLLSLGGYFYVLSAGRSLLHGLASGTLPGAALSVVGVFVLGAALGLVGFSRLVGYCLSRWTDLTVGGLVGLMVGCLRGVWPFRRSLDGNFVNVLPVRFGPRAQLALLALLAGFVLVALLTRMGRSKEATP